MPRLVRVLRELCAEEGVDQDVVRGKLSHLFSALPADVAAHKHEEAMHANGLCRVRVLQRLEERHLQDLGVTLGDAIMILDELFEQDAGVSAAAHGAAAEVDAAVAQGAVHRRQPEMRPFPKLGPTGYPDLTAWEAYRAGLRARMQSMMSGGVAQLAAIEAGGDVDPVWVNGCADDLLLFPELMNGAGCLPDASIRKLPRDLKQNSAAISPDLGTHKQQGVCSQ